MKTLLQLLGLRTTCCNAAVVTWHHDKHYCQHCERWLEKLLPEPAKVPVVRVITKQRPAH